MAGGVVLLVAGGAVLLVVGGKQGGPGVREREYSLALRTACENVQLMWGHTDVQFNTCMYLLTVSGEWQSDQQLFQY